MNKGMLNKSINLYLITILIIYSPDLFAHKLKFVAEELPPFHYLDKNKQPVGVLVDVLNAVLHQANLQADIELLPFARSYELTVKNPDILMFSFLKTPSRTPNFKWVGQVYTNKAYLVGLKNREDIQLYTLNDAKEYILGTIRGYYSETFLRQANFTTKRHLYLTVNYTQLWGMLLKGRIDLILTNTIALESELKSLNITRDSVNLFFEVQQFPSELHIAAGLKTSNKTIIKLADALKKIKQNHVYDKILAKWSM